MDTKVLMFCPTYRRTAVFRRSINFDLLKYDNFFVVANEEYSFVGKDKLIITPEHIEGNLARKRNWILDTYMKDDVDAIVMLDDDVKGLKWLYTNEFLTPEEFVEALTWMAEVAKFLKAPIFGFREPRGPRITEKAWFSIFGYNSLINSALIGILDKKIRYDDNLWIREDIDLSIQCQSKGNPGLMCNFIGVEIRYVHSKGEGGDRINTTHRKIQHDIAYLKEKWKNYPHLLSHFLKKNRYFGRIGGY